MKKFKIITYYIFLLYSFNLYADAIVYEIKAKNVNYDKNNNTITAIGDAEAKSQENKKIFADKIIYDKNLDLITTEGHSVFFDDKNFSIFADRFEYNTKLRTILASTNVVIRNDNTIDFYEFDNFKYYELNETGSGNKFKGKLKDGSTILAEQAELDKQSGIKTLTKARYTPCKNIVGKGDEFCPSWSASSSSATHDEESKTITYKNAFLNLRNIPVMYTPYLNVPDPTVKRQSGFLSPSIKKLSDIATTLSIPYFFAISDDRDLTITPVIYTKENNVYLADYRQKFKNSSLQIDSSFSKGYENINEQGRTSGSRNHFFLNFEGNYKNILFDENNVKMKLQRVNQSTYLLINQINTDLVKYDMRNLENSVEISSFADSKFLNIKSQILQNLDARASDAYDYIIPQINFSTYKTLDNHLLNFSSSFTNKNTSTNQNQVNLSNNLSTSSNPYILSKIGLGSVLKTNITNINLNNDNVSGQKDNFSSTNYLTLALDNSYPLYKKNNETNTSQDLTPKLFVKYTTGSMLDNRSSGKILTYSDIYSMNRMDSSVAAETGFSVGVGIDWNLIKSDLDNNKILVSNFSLGQVLKTSSEINMPTTSSLQNKSSDVVGSYSLNFYGDDNLFTNKNNILNIPNYSKNTLGINYQFNVNNNLSSIIRNLFTISGIYKTNYLSTTYEKNSSHIGNAESLYVNFQKLLHDTYFFNIENKINLINSYTEFSTLGIFREDDCLKIGFGFKREEYANKDLKPNRSLYFTITFKPFGEASKYDLSNFVK